MRRAGHLMPAIADPDNLRQAFLKAARGKSGKREVQHFRDQLDVELPRLRAGLLGEVPVSLGDYHYFMIRDPKPRRICAAAFRERVLHHAIMNVCEPVFERFLLPDTFACRKGYGRQAAADAAQRHAKQYPWHLQLDIRRYFDSIHHRVLKCLLERRFKDPALLSLFARLLDTYETTPGRGLPIGNLTSQHFANFYLGHFDHWIKRTLKAPAYIRYMDDFVLWHDDKDTLKSWHCSIVTWLDKELYLDVKPPVLNHVDRGLTFLGFRLRPGSRRLTAHRRHRLRRRARALSQDAVISDVGEGRTQTRLQAIVALCDQAGGPRDRRSVFLSTLSGKDPRREPREPRRQLEQ